MNRVSYLRFFLLLICGCGSVGFAQWSNDPNINAAIQITPEAKTNIVMTSDGAGGAIMAWEDFRGSEDNRDIYAQRVNASGVVQWQSTGVPICVDTLLQHSPHIVSNGAGGAIIVWSDRRFSVGGADEDRIYAQRINGNGIVQWATDGVMVSTLDTAQNSPSVISDNAGGAIVTWSNGSSAIYVQRILSNGMRNWKDEGNRITNGSNVGSPKIISDGNGGSIIAWVDYRNGNPDIFAQKINSLGNGVWTVNGVAICTVADYQVAFQMVKDSLDGVIIAWEDWRNGSTTDIYAQRVDGSGNVRWLTDGEVICSASGNQDKLKMVSDSVGGVILVWEDHRNGIYSDLYGQRVNGSGKKHWPADGVNICSEGYGQESPSVMSDVNSGCIVSWQDGRNSTDYNIYAQRIANNGTSLWDSCGRIISSESHYQGKPKIMNDGNNGAIIIWEDGRNDNFANDIYGHRIDFNVNGIADEGENITKQFELYQNYPNPFNPSTVIRYQLPVARFAHLTAGQAESPERLGESYYNVTLKVYNMLGVEVATLVDGLQVAGYRSVEWDASGLSSGIYYYKLSAGNHQELKKMIFLR